MKYLGLDYGSKVIGVAVSDADAGFAFPRPVIDNDAKIIDTLKRIVASENIDTIVMGDTRALNGRDNTITGEALRFSDRLTEALGVPVEIVNEAWSTHEAARFAPENDKHNDSAAAAIILQRFLDTRAK